MAEIYNFSYKISYNSLSSKKISKTTNDRKRHRKKYRGGGLPVLPPSPNRDRVKDIHGISEADKCTKCLHPADERSLAAADICPFNV